MDWPGEKLVIRLWETVADKGIGSLLKPWQIRREGRAHIDVRREELLLLAQAEKDAEAIRTGEVRLLSDGKVVEGTLSQTSAVERGPTPSVPLLPSIAQIAVEAVAAEALRKEINVGRALVQAEAELSGDPQEPPPKKPDDDWLFRWRDSASAVSNTELQQLWGRVLAGEVKAPGQFSLRTLEFLRNISQEEARAIEKLGKACLGDVIYRNDTLLQGVGIDFTFLLSMQDLGIVSGVESIGIEMTLKTRRPGSYIQLLFGRDRALLITHVDDTKVLKIPIYQVTTIGQQVLKLGATEPDMTLLTGVGDEICKQGFDVAIARYTVVDENSVRYFDAVPLCSPPTPQQTNP